MNENEVVFKLRSCVWEITLGCCFSCKYCGSKAGKARKNELTTEECLDVAKQLAELGCRMEAIPLHFYRYSTCERLKSILRYATIFLQGRDLDE